MGKSIHRRFEEMTKLYHFTSFKAACSIIESRELRFGKMFKMNDLIESGRIHFGRIFSNNLPDKDLSAEDEMHRYQQISFIQDRVRDDFDYLGFDLHAMWGLYAERGYGACLVFDRNKLRLEEGDYARDVWYGNFIPSAYDFRNKSKRGLRSEIWRRKDEIFFGKRKEWEHEQEFRVIRRARNEWDDEYLDVYESLSFVIICKDESVEKGMSNWCGDHYYTLKHLKNKVPILSYEYDLDWYTLYSDKEGDPIWAEQLGYYW